MTLVRKPRPTGRADFLAWETAQDDRWELINGLIRMMAGGSADHNIVTGNIFAALLPVARSRGCMAFQQNQKLAPDGVDDVVYPDVFVTCRPFAGTDQTIGSAVVVVEVTSKSSVEIDREDKFELYALMPDLRHYLIVDSRRRSLVHYHRTTPGEEWRVALHRAADDAVTLDALGTELTLAAVYEGAGV
ncbi:MAG: hypothetical protein RLY86_2883 [Pseudomonadota bacterium]|jgi:Uma2 family endonuclease